MSDKDEKEILNPEQRQAVEHLDGPLLVLAGAGSGKTRVVTERIIYLLQKGILPSDILAVTFTNKAAKEMQMRISEKTHSKVLTCTFHSLGARILRESIQALNYTRDFTIYDEEDSLNLIKSCVKAFDIKEEPGLIKTLKASISSAKNALLAPSDVKVDPFTDRKEKLFQKIYPLYQTKLQEYNAVDFDDLLYLPVKIFHEKPPILEEYQNRWLFVLVDEYQDTNHAQYILLKMLVAKHKNLFAVGDPDQSIYSWRGADYENILRFDQDFPHAITIKLEKNYRSTNTILSASNALIKHNEKRLEKNLWSTFGKGEKIDVFIAQSEKTEASFVIQKMLDLIPEKRIPLSEIAILYRTNAQSRVFEDFLLLSKIPYIIYGGLSFYQRKEVKDILAFLHMAVSDRDFLAFARTINIPKRGIGKSSIQKLLELASEQNLPILSLCKEIAQNGEKISLSFKQKESLGKYVDLILKLRAWVASKKPLFEIISDLIRDSDYLTHLKEDPETFEDRKENIDALIGKAAEWEEERESSSLIQFLEDIALITSLEEQEKGECIKLMTIHNAKGLEFSLVFIVGLEEDLFPHMNVKDHFPALEEERRLFYVGMTRAKKFLVLTASYYRMIWGTTRFMIPSRFLKEIPAEYLQNVSPTDREREERIDRREREERVENGEEKNFPMKTFQERKKKEAFAIEKEREEKEFSIGDKVEHKIFGIGIIQKSYESSVGKTYDVYFPEDQMERSLVAKYAKLKLFLE
jgi:DNA helicase II / ATP-dependent DNA helicase PcrA